MTAAERGATSSSSTATKPTTSALAAARIGRAPRDSSPALAKEIASRRGIPSTGNNQPSPSAQARARQLSPESQGRSKSSTTSAGARPKVPPSIVDSQAELVPAKAKKKAEDDDGFAKFYSSITTGTMSKLSSAMAFAGMPLTQQESSSAPTDQSSSNKRTVSASNEPDVTKIFSKASLDAVEAEHRRKRGAPGHVFGPAESFYVVQTGGGTYSYADIAKAQQQHNLTEIGEEGDEDAFVDAQEMPQPSPRYSRSSSATTTAAKDPQRLGPQRRGTFGKGQTAEELELENATLKQTLEHLAGRLANFEAHAQDASMAALTQSMAGLRPVSSRQQQQPYQGSSPPPASEPSLEGGAREGCGGGNDGQERIKALEEEREKLAALSAKQQKKLQKYEAKWLELQKGAREKRDRARKDAEEGSAGGGEGETTG